MPVFIGALALRSTTVQVHVDVLPAWPRTSSRKQSMQSDLFRVHMPCPEPLHTVAHFNPPPPCIDLAFAFARARLSSNHPCSAQRIGVPQLGVN
jgi:hypothetical protein